MKVIATNNFNNFDLNVYGTNEEPLFKVSDICKCLNVEVYHSLKHIPDNLKVVKTELYEVQNGTEMPRKTIYIKEPALYRIAFRSKVEKAEEFVCWITEEVLPTLRKTGKYEIRKYDKSDHTLTIKNEYDLHSSVVKYIREYNEKNKKRILFTASLGELQDTEDKRLKSYRLGYTSGQPDILILNKTAKYDGYALEFKSPSYGGRLSIKQDDKLNEYENMRYKILVSNDLCDIVSKLTKYFKKIRLPCKYCNQRFITNQTLRRHIKYFHKINI